MDFNKLKTCIQEAEDLKLEARDFVGLRVGELYRSWPEEVLSGRCARTRSKSGAQPVIKAYVKFAQAARELEEALGSPTPLRAPRTGKKVSFPDSRALVMVPTVETAPVPLAGTTPELTRVGFTAAKAAISSARATGLHDVHFPAWLQQQIGDRALTQEVANVTAASPQAPRKLRWVWFVLAGLMLAVPHLCCRVAALLVERTVTSSVAAAASFGTAASTEFGDAGSRMVHFIEDILDVCVTDPQVSAPDEAPPSVASVAAAAAARVAVLGDNSEGKKVAKDVAQAVALVVNELDSRTRAAQVTQPSTKLPGWMVGFLGVLLWKLPMPRFNINLGHSP